MQTEYILLEKRNSVACLYLNRPEVRNALNASALAELEAKLRAIRDDSDCRALILSGSEGQFCAGADLNPEPIERYRKLESGYLTGDAGGDILERGNRCILLLRNMKIPVLASISGKAVGFGCSLALACDLRIASDTAGFGFVFSRLGLGPDGGASYFLTQLVGTAKALELTWFGDIISANEAHQLGLVNKLVSDEALGDVSWSWAKRLARGAPLANAVTKEAVYRSCDLSLEQMLDLETRNQRVVTRSQDVKEGIGAFFEKREPEFQGN